MVRLGNLQLEAPFFQAGLAGYSDGAMRLVARRHGCPYCVTEAMLDQVLLNGGKGRAAAVLDRKDHPIAGQLIGSEPRPMAAAASLLVGLGYDVIDVNLACPVRKVRRRFRGGHLLAVPDAAIAVLDAVRQSVPASIPCTVKLRRGTDDSAAASAGFFRIFEAAIVLGYAGAVVHARTVVQRYVGPAQWPFLRDLVARYGRQVGFTIGGSGDVWSAADIFRMLEQTGVSLVSVARGCIGNPWLFAQARSWLAGDAESAARPPTLGEQCQALRAHFDLAVSLHGAERAVRMMRKFGIRFALHHPQSAPLREAFLGVASVSQWGAVLDRYYVGAGPGGEVLAQAACA